MNMLKFTFFYLFISIFVTLTSSQFLYGDDSAQLNKEGLKLFKSGDLKEASLKFEQALSFSPDNQILKQNLLLCLNNLAINEANSGHNRDSLFYFEKIKSLNPESGTYLLNYGNVLSKIGEDDQALWIYIDALDKKLSDKDRAKTLFSISNSYFKQEMYDNSIGYCNTLLELDNSYPGVYYLLASANYKRGNLDDTINALELGIKRETGEYKSLCQQLLKRVKKEYSVEKNFSTSMESHFIIQFDGEEADDVLDSVRDALNSAYKNVGYKFNYYVEGKIPVIIYTGAQFQRASTSPRWVAALYDGKIRLPIGDIKYSNSRLNSLVSHEFTHCIIYHLSKGKCPAWLNEGFAQIMENRVTDSDVEYNLRKAAKSGTLIKLDYLKNSFVGFKDIKLINLAYDQSYLLTKYLVDKYGMYTFENIFESMRKEDKSGKTIIEESLYKSYDEILKEFATYIIK